MELEHSLALSRAFGMLSENEVLALSGIVKQLPQHATVVNIGAGTGTSGLTVKETRPDIELWSVDMRYESPFGGLKNEHNAFDVAGIKYDVHPIHAMSDEAAITYSFSAPDKINLLIVDAGHLRPDIETDINVWSSLLSDNAIILFHDYGSPNWPDVKLVVDEKMIGTRELGHVDTYIWFMVNEHYDE